MTIPNYKIVDKKQQVIHCKDCERVGKPAEPEHACEHIVMNMGPSSIVVARKHLDPPGANVPQGMLGVCFHEDKYHADNEGPMVRWMNGGCCNVYPGDVDVVLYSFD